MPNILILGATGYIGQTLALSLLRSGSHIVYGLARSSASAKSLAALEIIPVPGSVSDSAGYLSVISSAHIDIVVDATGAGQESKKILQDLIEIGKKRSAEAEKIGIRRGKLGFVYVSGTWVHGSSNEKVNDLTPVGCAIAPSQPTPLTSWRTILEQEIIAASEHLDTVVVRPALVYGRANTIWTPLFVPLLAAIHDDTDNVSISAEIDSRPALCHVDDVASGIHAAINKLPLISGTGVYPVFDLITSQESMSDILTAAGKALGYKGEVKLKGAGPDLFLQAMSVTTNGNSGRAIELLGWQPKRVGYVQNMDLIAKSWAANQS